MVLPKMNNFPLTGGCNCGAIRFEVTEPLVMASYCLWGKRAVAASRQTDPATDLEAGRSVSPSCVASGEFWI